MGPAALDCAAWKNASHGVPRKLVSVKQYGHVRYIAARVSHIQPLVQALRTAAYDDDLLTLERIDTVGELRTVHEAALPKLNQLLAHR